jgi:Family of unknown function (DUF5709)
VSTTDDNENFGDTVYEQGDLSKGPENLDPVENLTGDDPDEVMQTSYVPPHREPYNLSRIPTPFEERQGESLDDHLAEEEPEIWDADPDADGTEPDPRAGRLVAPNQGFGPDLERDEIAQDVGPAGYASSAEEAAVHIIDADRVDDDSIGDLPAP